VSSEERLVKRSNPNHGATRARRRTLSIERGASREAERSKTRSNLSTVQSGRCRTRSDSWSGAIRVTDQFESWQRASSVEHGTTREAEQSNHRAIRERCGTLSVEHGAIRVQHKAGSEEHGAIRVQRRRPSVEHEAIRDRCRSAKCRARRKPRCGAIRKDTDR